MILISRLLHTESAWEKISCSACGAEDNVRQRLYSSSILISSERYREMPENKETKYGMKKSNNSAVTVSIRRSVAENVRKERNRKDGAL